ncbi:tetratricopeptide repeat protein [Actinacidiphila acididurans]|uniref:Tetratricopeptide repeat protein n=1 Tax=Actinacidiphila acididurans TaxID=2784346 RepID=A0ABS2TRV8_9ACTN|nr:tetratricopeptide repeat protein [Actinacidiphila acididurans]MBM9506069.1 tetratricopeptide repeat protein [Actinacidiphila acididurans]
MTDQALNASPAEDPATAEPTGAERDAGTVPRAAWALPAPPAHFVGRTRELAQLRADIARPGLTTPGGPAEPRARVLLVVGRPGTGRTALALRLAREVAADYPDGAFFVTLTAPSGAPLSPDRVARALLAAPAPARQPSPPGAPATDRTSATSASAVRSSAASASASASTSVPAPPAAGGSATAAAVPTATDRPDPKPSEGPQAASGQEAAGGPVAQWRARTEGRRVLVVLDGARGADQVAELLPRAAGSLVVVTSDGPLFGVPDVRPCTLGGLDTPAGVALLARTIGPTRVTNDPRAAEALVQETAGHPTALRLVGAWLAERPRTSMADAVKRLRETPDTPVTAAAPDRAEHDGAGEGDGKDTRDDTETADPAPKPPAPGELVRAFRLVHQDLPAVAARMLRLLVLAPAGVVDAQVASALVGCSVAAAEATLSDFTAGGLLGGADGRYAVPDCLAPLLRAELAARDRPEDVQLARARMLERTVRLLQSCRAALAGESPADGLPPALRFASAAAAAQWLREKRPALMAAARSAVTDGDLDTLARRLIAALVRTLAAWPGGAGATAAERYELHRLVLDVARRRGLHRETAAALINIADLDAEAGRPQRALETYRRALDAARAGDDTEAEGRALEALGGTYLELQDLPRATDWFGRALALRQARGELPHQARLHARIGAVLTYLGRYGPALREWRSAAGVHRRLGDLGAQARALTEVARVQEYAGHPEDALRTCRDALYWARQAGERRLEAAVLLRLADTLGRLGDPAGSRLHRAAAAKLLRPGELPPF